MRSGPERGGKIVYVMVVIRSNVMHDWEDQNLHHYCIYHIIHTHAQFTSCVTRSRLFCQSWPKYFVCLLDFNIKDTGFSPFRN